MTLISIMICLLLERWKDVLRPFRTRKAFICYASFLQRHLKTAAVFGSWPGIIVIFLPLVILVALIQFALHQFWYGILAWVFNTLVLLYCLEPHNCYKLLCQQWCEKKQNGDISETSSEKTDSVDDSFFLFNQRVFAVLFWFCLFGAVGALFYRAVTVCRQNAIVANSELNGYFGLLTQLTHYLDWIPIRLLAASFALTGNFTPAFQSLMRGFFQCPDNNEMFLKEVGISALQETAKVSGVAAQNLLFRSLVLWLVFLAVLTLTAIVK
ncbi:MAG: regulatory signaling modulator protein AmpE [Legionellales bacterium]|nr:regulatory signaling modulator protein AmpE [Legionellales bacterium]